MTKHGLSLVDRMMLHGEQDPETKCVNWTGSLNKGGYGKVRVDGESRLVTRIWWGLIKGAPPGQLDVLHKCDNPACFNIDHLFLGGAAENARDSMRKGRYKLLQPALPEDVKKQAEDLLRLGWSLASVARNLDIGETSVARIRDRMAK